MEYQRHDECKHLLEIKDLTLNYGRCKALRNLHLTLGYSEVHAIVGEHGSGKSSLGMVISGMLKPHSGHIVFEDNAYRNLNFNTAHKLGIEMVYQQTSLNEYFTVAENLFFTDTRVYKFRWNNKKHLLHAANSLLSHYKIDLDPSIILKYLSSSDRILVDILKHIYSHPKLLILDEVLERLSSASFQKIITILIQLKQQGLSILFITRSIDDIYHVADKVSIMKNGELLVTDYVKNIGKINLMKMAYTQLSTESNIENLNQEFYQFLQYNEAILRNLPVNLIVTDDENSIKMVNDYCKKYFRLKKSSYFNVPLEYLLSSNNDEVLKLIKSAFSFKEEKAFYQVPVTLNEIHAITNIKTFPIYDGALLIGNIIIIEDITEYDQLQKQLILSEKLASVGLLAAGVAHEINNPLEIIYNYLSYIKYNFHGKELHEAIDNVHEEISSITNIVSNLLTFSDSHKKINEEIDMNTLIRSMINLIKPHAKNKQITIRFEPHIQDIVIRANKNEIKQVILNLLKNSFEAMPSGGDIFIKTTHIKENSSNFVQMTFEDTGCGINDENPNNIFLPFYSTKKGAENNLGLGLSVSYGIIKKYNGTISVKNIALAGCQFLITIPQVM